MIFKKWCVSVAVAACLINACSQAGWSQQGKPAGKPEPAAAGPQMLKVKAGFKAELLYTVPRDDQGSWVSMCTDPQGRLVVCDQYGGLYRVTPPGILDAKETVVTKLDLPIGGAQGLLWAFDSLYIVVNSRDFPSGLHRATDTDGDGELDTVKQLTALKNTGGEHGPHAVLLAPDGKSLYVVCGNQTGMPELAASRVPRVWDEDLLLPRVYGRGFMKGTPAPGGFICQVDPEGKSWKLVASGFRNQYDAAFNAQGELFTYDADMEWDMNTPWYRPTRICHVVSGAEFGWRNGSGKWPAYYPDSVPGVVDIGPGSPTGVTFGYGAKFPAKYQQAMFCCDWSYGKLYAVHLSPSGASYRGEFEEFITGTPLPLTDIVINPQDGAMYFAIGGRRVQSALYRVTYVGGEKKADKKPANPRAAKRAANRAAAERAQNQASAAHLANVRLRIESLHQGEPTWEQVQAVAVPYLSHEDRALRYAARVALEHVPHKDWQDAAFAETDAWGTLQTMLALSRVGDESLKPRIVESLVKLDYPKLSRVQRMALVRTYGVLFSRHGEPAADQRTAIRKQVDEHFTRESAALNLELCQLLVYLDAPEIASRAVQQMVNAPSQEEQISYAKSLRMLPADSWTMEDRKPYFAWFARAAGYRGGNSFGLFVQHIKEDAVAKLDQDTKAELQPILSLKPEPNPLLAAAKNRKFVKEWTVEEIVPLLEAGLEGRDFKRGRRMFGAGSCFACHRFNNEGGAVGPDLTGVSGRFNPRDLAESIVLPSKTISDQYGAVNILTVDGETVTGRIVNLSGDVYKINTNMLEPNAQTNVKVSDIEIMQASKVSMMPKGLLNTLNKDELLDLLAYLLSRGDPDHAMFRQPAGK